MGGLMVFWGLGCVCFWFVVGESGLLEVLGRWINIGFYLGL